MNIETNEFLDYNLEDAHAIFLSIIDEMQEKNIDANYTELVNEEAKCYYNVRDMLNKMSYYISTSNRLVMENKKLFDFEYACALKYFSLYVLAVFLIWGYHKIFDTGKMEDIVKYIIGLFLGGTFMGLFSSDIYNNRNCDKETRDLFNELKTMKEEYKKYHDKAVCEINGIFKLNDTLIRKMEQEKVKSK